MINIINNYPTELIAAKLVQQFFLDGCICLSSDSSLLQTGETKIVLWGYFAFVLLQVQPNHRISICSKYFHYTNFYVFDCGTW